MFDFKFNWSPQIETGIAEIDDQHKVLLRIGRDIEQFLQYRCIGVTEKQLLDIICELRDYTAYHYYEEEALMEQAGYPKLEEQKAEHRKFAEYVEHIDCPAMRDNPERELKKVRDALQDMIFNHMMVADKEMGEAIRPILEAQKAGKT